MCAALASAVAPRLRVTGARNLPVPIDPDPSIDEAGLIDSHGHLLDVLIADRPAMDRLEKRAGNAALIADAAGRAGLDIAVDVALAQGRTRDEENLPVYVAITRHIDGIPRDPEDLTEEECRSLGLAIARVHALDTGFLLKAGHTAYSGAQVRDQLTAWTRGLSANASVPDAITARWDELLRIDTLWDFSPVVSHGGFAADDILFSIDSTVTALRHWERLGLADPAADFAWMFDDGIRQWQRDEVLSGYGEGLGDRMDPRIVPRARLWRQMTAVRSLLQALAASDHDRLAQARRTVNAIASSLSPVIAVGAGHPVTAVPGSGTGQTATKAERAEGTGSTADGTACSPRTGGTSGIVPKAMAGPGTTPTGTGQAAGAKTGTDTGMRTGTDTGNGMDGGLPSDETRESAPVSDGTIDTPSIPGGQGQGPQGPQDPASPLPGLDDGLVVSGEDLRFSGTGSVRRQDAPGTTGTGTSTDTDARQDAAAARFATNTNMPAIEPDGTRTSLAAAADTRHADGGGQQAQDARTRPFQTQAYIDTDAPDATVTVTHSTSVRERLFPDDPGEELFKPEKDGAKGETNEDKNEDDDGPDAGTHTDAGN